MLDFTVIREMPVKATVRYSFSPIKLENKMVKDRYFLMMIKM